MKNSRRFSILGTLLLLGTSIGATYNAEAFTTISHSQLLFTQGYAQSSIGGDLCYTFPGYREGAGNQSAEQYFSTTGLGTMLINEVTAPGVYLYGPSHAQSFIVNIFQDHNGQPGELKYTQRVYGDFNSPNVDLHLNPVYLKEGNYWIGLIANMPDSVTMWGWGEFLPDPGLPRVAISHYPFLNSYPHPGNLYSATIFSLYGFDRTLPR